MAATPENKKGVDLMATPFLASNEDEHKPDQRISRLVSGVITLAFITSLTVNAGWRDWTRTNDPHHVKVVL